MFHGIHVSCHSLQYSCLSVFEVAISYSSLEFKFAATSLHSQGDDSDIELVGVDQYSPPPASTDDESEDKYLSALEGEEEQEEEEELV